MATMTFAQIWSWKRLLSVPVTVYWDDSDMPYTARGPRQEGSFVSANYLRAWCWALCWTFLHPRAAVYIREDSIHPDAVT